MLSRRQVLLLSLVSLSSVLMAPTCGEGLPPSGTLLRVTSNPRVEERPTALSDRFVLYHRSLDSVDAYDRDTGTAGQIAQDFTIEVAASDEHVGWLTPFSTVVFLKVWEAASGRLSFVDTARSGVSFGDLRFVGRRLFYFADGFHKSIRIWDPGTGLIEEIDPGCNTRSWDATPTFVAWTCSFERLVRLYDLESGAVTEIVSPPMPNSRPERMALADEWVVWVVERSTPTSAADLFAAPLAGGPVRTLATGLLRDSTVTEFDAGGGFAAWWDRGRLQLHDFAANATIAVGDGVLRRPPRVTQRYLIWLEIIEEQLDALRLRNLATGLEMVEDLTDPREFRDLYVNDDSLVYFSDPGNDIYLFEIDGDSDGIRDRDERRYALGDLDDPDGDGDGTLDGAEDPDGDGLSSADEIYVHGTDPTLADTDGDGLDDATELLGGTDPLSPDTDSDSISDSTDECPLDPLNDPDADGVCGSVDNCPAAANPDQSDLDGDGMGDACDPDADGDGLTDAQDACVSTEVGEVVNADGCSITQLCPCVSTWKRHRAYVRCVVRATGVFRRADLISRAERRDIIRDAKSESCGERPHRFTHW